jgi:hypothetical protein
MFLRGGATVLLAVVGSLAACVPIGGSGSQNADAVEREAEDEISRREEELAALRSQTEREISRLARQADRLKDQLAEARIRAEAAEALAEELGLRHERVRYALEHAPLVSCDERVSPLADDWKEGSLMVGPLGFWGLSDPPLPDDLTWKVLDDNEEVTKGLYGSLKIPAALEGGRSAIVVVPEAEWDRLALIYDRDKSTGDPYSLSKLDRAVVFEA